MATITQNKDNTLTIEVTISPSCILLDMENRILDACNDVGCLATGEALKKFDIDGSPITMGGIKWTARAKVSKKYQTSYGVTETERYVYQASKGGRIYCPLEAIARTFLSATPKFAQQLSHKYSQGNAQSVCTDLNDNHHRTIAKSMVQNVADFVGTIACAKEEKWAYSTPEFEQAISTVVFSLDGAYLLMQKEGYREARVSALSLYDVAGERQHTIYLGEAPEYGKASFKARYEQEIQRLKARYPDALYLGITDGAADNWSFLMPHTDRQLLDFYHVTEYLAKAVYAIYPQKNSTQDRQKWLTERCTQLKHQDHSAQTILQELEAISISTLPSAIASDLEATLAYFRGNIAKNRMDYAKHVAENLPIGSGVTEASCKMLVKQGLCGSGMRWKSRGAKIVLSRRALVQTKNRWQQFLDKIDQFGAEQQLLTLN